MIHFRAGALIVKTSKNFELEANKDPNSQSIYASMNQVHGDNIELIKSAPTKNQTYNATDGLITNQKNLSLIINTADCIPLIIHDPENKTIAAIHAGWRGLVKGIHTKSISILAKEFQSKPKRIKVHIQPSIRKCCYTFKDEPTQNSDPNWQPFITHQKDEWSIDLVGFLKNDLVSLGILPSNISDSHQCTYHQKEKWYSHLRHKRLGEASGRMITAVQLAS